MGFQRLIVLTAFLFTKGYEVSAQYATVMECLSQPTASIARPIVQSGGQFILPAIIQPIINGYDSYTPDPVPSYPNYSNYPSPYPGLPPIILDDGDDMLRNLLYILILSMGNRKSNNCNMSPSYGNCCSCGCSGSSKCKCSCDCPNCSKNNTDNDNSGPTYIPVPIAIPVYTGSDGCRYIDGFCDDILIQGSCGQSCNCNVCSGKEANEINLIIKTDC